MTPNDFFEDVRAVKPPAIPRGRAGLGPEVPVSPGPNRSTPLWADLTNDWGRADPRPGDGYPPMQPPPWGSLYHDLGHEPGNARRPVVLAVLAAMLLVFLVAAGFVIQRLNVLPAGVPLIGKDTGVALCEAMATGSGPVGEKTGQPNAVSNEQIRQVRAAFADSRYSAIRLNGVRMMDQMAQIAAFGNGTGEDPGFGALAFLGGFADAYAGLAGGCADVGYTLPPLSQN